MNITVTENGVSGFNCDEMDRMNLGHRKVPRVSDISWNEDEQTWEVRAITSEERIPLSNGRMYMERTMSPVLYRNPVYKTCVEWEKNNEPLIRSFL